MPEQPTEPDLSDLLHRIAHAMRRGHLENPGPTGITPHQWRALHVIAQAETGQPGPWTEGPLRPRDVATRLRIAPRSAAEVVAQLVDEGWVSRRPDPADRRAVRLEMTETGAEVYEKVRNERNARNREFFGTIPDADRKELRRILTSLLENAPGSAGPQGPSGPQEPSARGRGAR